MIKGIKNRAPAPIQISAEQLLREAQERGFEEAPAPPEQTITDREELLSYQQGKRKDFEDQLRRKRQNIGIWCKYALWEASQNDFERARSVFERALDVDYRNQTLWFKYAEMEMKHKYLNHARNIWDRAVTLLPRQDSMWYKYTYMEEMVGAVENARGVFERWMAWEPDDLAWAAYIKFEMRQHEVSKARALYERYVVCHPTARAFLKYARWEETGKNYDLARGVYEKALTTLSEEEVLGMGAAADKGEADNAGMGVLRAWGAMEERVGEVDRARVIYNYLLSLALQKEEREGLVSGGGVKTTMIKTYLLQFEKKHGDRVKVEEEVLRVKREQYEHTLSTNYYDYDVWMDYAKLEENELYEGIEQGVQEGIKAQVVERVRGVYSRATSFVPLSTQKPHWKRYIYLFIFWAVFEELYGGGIEQAREVYRLCLNTLPNHTAHASSSTPPFIFKKIFVYAAELEIRNNDVAAARKILGFGMGLITRMVSERGYGSGGGLFRFYLQLELQLGEIERVRVIYQKYVEAYPYSALAWGGWASMEGKVGEAKRARKIFEIGLGVMEDSVEGVDGAGNVGEVDVLYKMYIDFELAQVDVDDEEAGTSAGTSASSRVRDIYERLVGKYPLAVKYWVAFAQFEVENMGRLDEEAKDGEAGVQCVERAREVYKRGYEALKNAGLKLERLHLLESWREMERSMLDVQKSTVSHLTAVESKFPRKVVRGGVGVDGEVDLLFPDDEKKGLGLKLLEKAMAWKRMGGEGGGEGVGGGEGEGASSVLGKRPGGGSSEEIDLDM